MMFLRSFLVSGMSLIMSFFVFGLSAQSTTNSLLKKSEEAFNAQRWKSAGTLYELLLKDSVNYSPYMAYALLANELAGDTVSLQRADAIYGANISRLDSLLTDFSKLCVRLHHFDVFEESLDRLRRQMPDKNNSLLYGMIEYRFFLRDAQGAIRLAQLAHLEDPDNLMWIRFEAQGWQMGGESEKALSLYRHILQKDPSDLDALVFIGNYYYLRGKRLLAEMDKEYNEQPAGSRREYAVYRNQVQEVLDNEISHAIDMLERAYIIRQNTTIAHTLYEMYVLKSDVTKANLMKKRL